MSQEQPTEPFRSFGRCARGTSIVYRPCDAGGVAKVFEVARKEGRRVVIRGGGHSFDGQALHDCDDGQQIVLNTDCFETDRIEFDDEAGTVTLGAGVQWGTFIVRAIQRATQSNIPIRLPGSLQTGRRSTVGGTLAGDCLSRFSGTVGKESQWIESFRLLTTDGQTLDVTAADDPDLFNAVVGGHGYIGFVTDATYRCVAIAPFSCARTVITRPTSFRDLIDVQLAQIAAASQQPLPVAVSAAWFTDTIFDTPPPRRIKGGVFNSTYASPSDPPLPGFPLYSDIDSCTRYLTELAARIELANLGVHEVLFQIAGEGDGIFENDLENFLFFMDGNTSAKNRFEHSHPGQQFPIVQQTFVVPTAHAEAFAELCVARTRSLEFHMTPSECDMLFVKGDDCLMSGNYKLDGFAISLGFEPIEPEGCPKPKLPELLRGLSRDCLSVGGRLHMVKNVCVEPDVFRQMYGNQIVEFENIKHKYDPQLILQNPFSDAFFQF